MKKFKTKKKRKIFKLIILVIFTIFIVNLTYNKLFDFKLKNNNQDFIIELLNNSNYHLLYKRKSILDKIIKKIITPNNLLKFNLKYNSSSDGDTLEVTTNYIEDPNKTIIDNPRVYLYNTHQLEGYDADYYSDYNITPNVQMTAYLLKDKLNNMNIPTIVENGNITDFLNSNNWSYNYSYKASRYFIEDTLKKYNNLDLIIDLHRDAIEHNSSTTEFEGKKYAKVMFVIGKDYDTFEQNLSVANKINELIKKYNPNISRGVIAKGGKGVNGIYNQDLNPNIILIECGGSENTLDEVINTVDILSKAIKEYLGEKNG